MPTSAFNDAVFDFLRERKSTRLHMRGAKRERSCWHRTGTRLKQLADLLHLLQLGTTEIAMNPAPFGARLMLLASLQRSNIVDTFRLLTAAVFYPSGEAETTNNVENRKVYGRASHVFPNQRSNRIGAPARIAGGNRELRSEGNAGPGGSATRRSCCGALPRLL
jgi:hypothetical protein